MEIKDVEKVAIKVIEALEKERFKYESAIEGVKLLVQELMKGQVDGENKGQSAINTAEAGE